VEVAVLPYERAPSAATSRAGSPPAEVRRTSWPASSTCCWRSRRPGSPSSSARGSAPSAASAAASPAR
jgi:hypothetical protein